MSKKTEVLVIGSGLAGLFAALVAANRGCHTRIVSEGMGSLAISGGSIDLLGYDIQKKRLENPWTGFQYLPSEHPYRILGEANVKSALDSLTGSLLQEGLEYKSLADKDGQPRNALIPTIMGTLKPTWLFDADQDIEAFENAKRILVASVKGFRDCRPSLIINQLRRYKDYENRTYSTLVLPPPFAEHHRSLNALDLAHVADRKSGMSWMLDQLKDIGKDYDVVLLPPMLGAKSDSPIRKKARAAIGAPVVEMLSVPPGVAGLRLRNALVNALHRLGAEFYENAHVVGAELDNGKCVSVKTFSTGREVDHKPDAVVVATGGVISGGVILSHGKAVETVFNLNIPVPENVDEWTEADIFGRHLITTFGVKVNEEMRPVDKDGHVLLENVFFAGRTLGGYDYASEKSGHGVAAATGWQAGHMAASTITGHSDAHSEKASGADK